MESITILQRNPVMPEAAIRFPKWMGKIIRRQQALNKKYETAHSEFARAYNDFLMAIDDVNQLHGTNFTFQQAVEEYQGMIANDAADDTDEDDGD